MQNDPWLFTLLITAAPQSYSAIHKVVSGEADSPHIVRRSYAFAAIFTLGFSTILAVAMRSRDPVLAGLAIVGASVVVQEFAMALQPLEEERPE